MPENRRASEPIDHDTSSWIVLRWGKYLVSFQECILSGASFRVLRSLLTKTGSRVFTASGYLSTARGIMYDIPADFHLAFDEAKDWPILEPR
jgi:hypothetical protein